MGAVVNVYTSPHRFGGHSYDLFWLGMLLLWAGLAPLIVELADVPRFRSGIVVLLGLISYLPFYLRNPTIPMFNDEDGHVAEVATILRTGRLFQPDPLVPLGPKFPGLETLTAAIVRMSDLPLFQVATIVIAICHILSVAGVVVIASVLFNERRATIYSGMLYAVSPTISFFDSQFSYESLAIPLCIWIIALVFKARSYTGRLKLVIYLLSVVLLFALDITHHFTSYVTTAILLCYAALLLLFRRGSLVDIEESAYRKRDWVHASAVFGIGLTGGSLAVVWVLVLRIPIVHYLGVFPEQGVRELAHLLFGSTTMTAPGQALSASGGTVSLFQGSGLPTYEVRIAETVPFVVLVSTLSTLWAYRRVVSAEWAVLLLLCGLYLASLPLLITSQGNAAAHRSWAVSWIGVSCVVAGGCSYWLTRRRQRHRHARFNVGRGRSAASAMVITLVVLLMQMGSYGANVNATEMFPGPFIMGVDGRTTNEQVDMAKWFATHEGFGKVVLTDHRNFEVLVAFADAQASSFPAWELFFPTVPPQRSVVANLYADDVQFVLVDKRLATDFSSFLWFSNSEPLPPSDPLPKASILKFSRLPYLRLIHSTQHLSLYKVLRGNSSSRELEHN